jgi:hypothetical protein
MLPQKIQKPLRLNRTLADRLAAAVKRLRVFYPTLSENRLVVEALIRFLDKVEAELDKEGK